MKQAYAVFRTSRVFNTALFFFVKTTTRWSQVAAKTYHPNEHILFFLCALFVFALVALWRGENHVSRIWMKLNHPARHSVRIVFRWTVPFKSLHVATRRARRAAKYLSGTEISGFSFSTQLQDELWTQTGECGTRFELLNGTSKLMKADFDIAVVIHMTLALLHPHAQRANFS